MPPVSEHLSVDARAGSTDFGLPMDVLDSLRAAFAGQPQVQRAVVYGSRAKGTHRPGSDIDVVLEAPALTFTDLLRLKTSLDDLMLPYQIDLSALHQIDNPALLDHIQRVGKPLWVRPA